MTLTSDPAALTSSELERFQQDGFLVFRNMASRETCERMLAITLDHLQRAVPPLEYEADVGYPGAPSSLDAPGGRTARRLRNAYQRDICFREWAEDHRIVVRMQQLLGEPIALTLAHHNCVMTKRPQYGTATGWHRDIRYWRFQRNHLITAWLALGEERDSNGALRVIPGSHRLAIQPAQLDDLDFLRPDVPENQALFAQGITPELHPGDVMFFHSGLFHSAGANLEDRVKTSVVFAYRGQSNLPLPGSRSATAGDVPLQT